MRRGHRRPRRTALFLALSLGFVPAAHASDLPYFRLSPGSGTGLNGPAASPSGIPAPVIATTAPAGPSGVAIAGIPLRATLTATAGRVATWGLRDAPPWLSVSTDGVITGTPPQGTAAFSYTGVGTDAYGRRGVVASGPVALQAPVATADALATLLAPGEYLTGQLASNLPSPKWTKTSGADWILVSQDGWVAGLAPAAARETAYPFTAQAEAYSLSAPVSPTVTVRPR